MAQLNFFQHFILCRNFYIFVWGDYPPFICSYTQEIRNFYFYRKCYGSTAHPQWLIVALQLNHIVQATGEQYTGLRHPQSISFFSPETNPMLWEGSQWETNHFTGMDMIPVCNLEARKSTKIVSTIVRREHSLYWPGNKIMVRDLLGGTWQYKWAT